MRHHWHLAILITLLFAVPFSSTVYGQKQLVLLKGEKIKLRLHAGDEFIFKLKGDPTIQRSYINNLFDTAVVAHKDVIPFHRIERIYFDQGNFMNVVGGLLVTGGVGYFLIDQVNVVIVQGEDPDLDKGVTIPSVAMIGVGLPMMLIKKKSQKIGGRYRLLTVEEGSPFYQPALSNGDGDQPD